MTDDQVLTWWESLNRNNRARFITPHLEMMTRGARKGFKAEWHLISDEEWTNYIQLCDYSRRKRLKTV